MNNKYVFKSERLGFRNWTSEDLDELSKMNSDSEVMEHFPKPLTQDESENLLSRFQRHYQEYGYTYFATEIIKTGEWIGFVGLKYQEYETEFTPAIDIGWRLKRLAWGNGYATEGAKRCLEFAFKDLELQRIIATCTERNLKSENVMKKIGMTKKGKFKHPKLIEFPEYENCICYEIKNE